MPVRRYGLEPLPPRSVNVLAGPALQHLETAHRTLQGIFDSLHIVRERSFAEKANARGRFKEPEVDLLRSALVLAGSGLDAVVKRLAADALPPMLASGRQLGAEKKFKDHVRIRVFDVKPGGDWIDAVLDADPRRAMIRRYVSERVAGSLQSEDELKKMRDAFGISEGALPDGRIESLRDYFQARNRIAHDLDIRTPTHPTAPTRGGRYTHKALVVEGQCNLVLGVAGDFIDRVSQNLGGPRAKP